MGILHALLTTIVNPTIWLLAALAVSAVVAMARQQSARYAFARTVGGAGRLPVLVLLGLAVVVGLAGRVGLGYLAPGSYAEEVLGARTFLEARQLYRGDDRQDFLKWLAEEPAPVTPWTLPGVTTCQASALESRPQFYTAQGHSPVLLLISVPIVAVGGGRALYLVFALLSLVALGGMGRALATHASVPPRSVAALILLLALAGWQPALAGIRQGDAVIVVAGLLVWAWSLLRAGAAVKAGLVAGLAGVLFPPALVLLIPVGFRSRRALMAGLAMVILAAIATVAVAGPMVFSDYATSTLASARLYVASPMTYSSLGHLLLVDPPAVAPLVWAALLIVGLSSAVAFTAGIGQQDAPGVPPAWPSRFDATMATFAVVTFLLEPLAWSQHATLLVLPLVILLGRVLAFDRPGRLVAWAVLALLVSLPDPAVVWMGVGVKLAVGDAAAAVLPSVPVWAATGLWTWLLVAAGGPGRAVMMAGNSPAFQGVP